MAITVEEFLDKEVTSLPGVFYQLREALQDADCTYDDFARIVSADVSLSSRLLKIVNSPFYGLPGKIENISHALTIVGITQLNDLAFATMAISKFKGIPESLIDMESFWRHSIACGMLAREIGFLKNEANVESLYLAGLLHDIGSLVVYNKAPNLAMDILAKCRSLEEYLFKTEHKVLGFNHTDVGGGLLKAWRIPDKLVEAAFFHHDPLHAKNYPVEAAIIHAADSVAYEMKLGTSGEPFIPPIEPEAFKIIRLTQDDLKQVKETVSQKFEDVVATFL